MTKEEAKTEEARAEETRAEETRALPPQTRVDYHAFLLHCVSENLNQMRHVENERVTFFSVFTAFMGVVIAYMLSNQMGALPLLFLSAFLLVFHSIYRKLLDRWNEVFQGHRDKAKELMLRLDDLSRGLTELPASYDLRAETERLNDYFYFDHRLNAQAEKKYIHTHQLFHICNLVICVVLIAFFVYAVINFIIHLV